jgi:3-dehydroquinate dehydratase-2
LVLNGPNLNLLGRREPEIYGKATLSDIEALCKATSERHGLSVDFRQSNSEGELIDWVQSVPDRFAGIIINPGGLSHTSVSLMDALAAAEVPIVEVHLSNIHRREEFRHHSYVSRVARGVIVGLGAAGYELAILALAQLLSPGRTASET